MAIRRYISGFIGLLFLSVAVFFIIYFFVPEVSMKFFGMAFDQEKAIETAIDRLDVSEEAKRMLSDSSGELASFFSENADELWAFMNSDEGRDAIESAARTARDGTLSFAEALSDRIGEE